MDSAFAVAKNQYRPFAETSDNRPCLRERFPSVAIKPRAYVIVGLHTMPMCLARLLEMGLAV
jgi:hypothetical protein